MAAEQESNPFRPPVEDGRPGRSPAWAPPGGGTPAAPAAPGAPGGAAAEPGGHDGYGGYGGPPRPVPAPGWGYPPGVLPRPGPRNGFGTAALVCGVIAATLCWTFVMSVPALLLGAPALVFGLVGARRARRGEATNRTVALGGAWTGAGAMLVSVAVLAAVLLWAADYTEVESAVGADYHAVAGQRVAFEDGVTVTFEEPERSAGGRTVTVTVTVVNDGAQPASLTGAELSAYVDDVGLRPDEVRRQGPEPGTLPPGGSETVTYTLLPPPPGNGWLRVDYAPGGEYAFGAWGFVLISPPGPDYGSRDV